MIDAFLAAHSIPFTRYDHDAVFTCDDVARLVPAAAAGVQTKNLFLRDHRGRRHWLLVTTCDTAVDLKGVAPLVGADHLSLASPERLAKFLGLTPGSVTVLGLVNDAAHAVTLVVDRAVWTADAWRCHPLVNTATLVIATPDVRRFLAATGHEATVVDVPVRA